MSKNKVKTINLEANALNSPTVIGSDNFMSFCTLCGENGAVYLKAFLPYSLLYSGQFRLQLGWSNIIKIIITVGLKT